MRARNGLFGGALMVAGVAGGEARAGGSPVTFQQSGAGVYGTKTTGEVVDDFAYLPGVVGEFSYDGAGLTMYSVSTPERIACMHTRSNTDTIWEQSLTGGEASFTVSEECTARISWDFAGWSFAVIYLENVSNNNEVLVEIDEDDGALTDSMMVTLSPGIMYYYYAGVGTPFGESTPGGGTGFVELDFIVNPITQQPSGMIAQVGSAAELALVADDAESFQWRKNGVPIGDAARGASGPALEFAQVSFEDLGVYDCVVTRFGEEFVSEPALLAVQPCLAGDANGDGVVGFSDLNAVLAQFGASCVGR